MTRVLVTGAAGFIGSHLAEHLQKQGHEVIGTDVRPRPRHLEFLAWQDCDLVDGGRVRQMLQETRPDAVVHLAARTDFDEMHDFRRYSANVEGTSHLVEAIAAAGTVKRTICVSSQLVCRIDYQPANDEDFQPSTAYGRSKMEEERIWRAQKGGGTTWCIVRPTTVWGPRMNAHYLRFFGMIRRGHYRHVGREERYKSYSYVGNLVRQYECLLAAPDSEITGKVFYLADYEPLALEAWADSLAVAIGAPPIPTIPHWVATVGARIGDVINMLGAKTFPFNSFRLRNVLTPYRADTAPIQRICPTLPFSTEDGVAETARWLRDVWAENGDVV